MERITIYRSNRVSDRTTGDHYGSHICIDCYRDHCQVQYTLNEYEYFLCPYNDAVYMDLVIINIC